MVQILKEEKDFDEFLKSEKILLQFYADWCGPCRMQGAVVDLITEFDVLKINVDNFPAIAMRYQVMSIPTLITYKDGKLIRQEPGFKTKEQIEAMFE